MDDGSFSTRVIALIRKIPPGKVASYGQIARLAGKPQGSRGVAWILHSCSESHQLPWHRVLNSQGQISFPPATKNHLRQKRLLREEGVLFSESGRIDLKKFQWQKRESRSRGAADRPRMFDRAK